MSGKALTEPSEKKLAAAIAAAKQEEAKLLGKLKFRRADLDKAKADLGLAVRDGLSQERQVQLQIDIDVVQVDVDAKNRSIRTSLKIRDKTSSDCLRN